MPPRQQRAAAAMNIHANPGRQQPIINRNPNYTVPECTELLDVIESILPIGAENWELVASRYNPWAHANGRALRNSKDLKGKFTKLAKSNKPTGDPNCPPEVVRAKNINRLIDEKVCLEEQGGDDMSDHFGNHGPGDGDGPGDDEGPGDGVAPGDVQHPSSLPPLPQHKQDSRDLLPLDPFQLDPFAPLPPLPQREQKLQQRVPQRPPSLPNRFAPSLGGDVQDVKVNQLKRGRDSSGLEPLSPPTAATPGAQKRARGVSALLEKLNGRDDDSKPADIARTLAAEERKAAANMQMFMMQLQMQQAQQAADARESSKQMMMMMMMMMSGRSAQPPQPPAPARRRRHRNVQVPPSPEDTAIGEISQ